MTVRYAIAGTAVAGVDYLLANGVADHAVHEIQIPAGQFSVSVGLTLLPNDLPSTLQSGQTAYGRNPTTEITVQVLSTEDYVGGGHDRLVIADNSAVISRSSDDLGGARPFYGDVIRQANADADKDLTPDFADGFDGDSESPSASMAWILLTAPRSLTSDFRWKLEYDASPPSQVIRPGAGATGYAPAPGHLRVWTPGAHRRAASFQTRTAGQESDGFFVPPSGDGYYTRADWIKLVGSGTTAPQSVTLRVEGVAASDLGQLSIVFRADRAGSGHYSTATLPLAVGTFDLDVDADNTGDVAPDRSFAEEAAEGSGYNTGPAAVPGKYVVVNDGDAPGAAGADPFGDGVPDFADGFNLDGKSGTDAERADDANPNGVFVPVVLELPRWLDPSTLVNLTYSASDPAAVHVYRTGADVAYAPAPGSLRLWTKDAWEQRNKSPVQNGGHYVPPGPHAASQLGFSATKHTVTLYAEAVRPSAAPGDLMIVASIVPHATGLGAGEADVVRLTALQAFAPPATGGTADSMGGTAEGADAGDPGAAGRSGPVRYADNAVALPQTDLVADGFGVPLTHTRVWTDQANQVGLVRSDVAGKNWTVSEWPSLIHATNGVAVVGGAAGPRWFDAFRVGGTGAFRYQARYFGQDTLAYDAGAHQYVLTDTLGNQTRFEDLAVTDLPAGRRGQFASFKNAAGKGWAATEWEPDGRVKRIATVGGPDDQVEAFAYEYFPDDGDPTVEGASENRLRSVTFERDGVDVRHVEYTYAEGTASTPSLKGQLASATVYAGGTGAGAVDRNYYRYDTAGNLRLAMDTRGAARLVADHPALDPWTATDQDFQKYAAYDVQVETGGLQVRTLDGATGASELQTDKLSSSYGMVTNPIDAVGFNAWRYKTTEQLDDSSGATGVIRTHLVYTNFAGEVLLDVLTATGSDQREWRTFYRYDDRGRLVLEANPSAVTGYDEAAPDLLKAEGADAAHANYRYLADNQGLLTSYEYNTADGSDGPAGYLKGVTHLRGEQGGAAGGTSAAQLALEYQAVILPTITLAAVHKRTVYAAEGGGHPIVTLCSGTSSRSVETFDAYNRVTNVVDARGVTHTAKYEELAAGLKVTNVTDPGTAPAHLNLTTSTQYDALGRVASSSDTMGRVTTTVFLIESDTERKVKVTPVAGPSSVAYERFAPGTVLTATVAPNANGASVVRSLSVAKQDLAGRTLELDRYHAPSPNLAESDLAGPPIVGFYATHNRFDAQGLQYYQRTDEGTVLAATVHGTDHDPLGRPTQDWVGLGTATTATTSGSTGVARTHRYIYDGGGTGDSLLTQSIGTPSGRFQRDKDDRYGYVFYDWRDRAVGTRLGAALAWTRLDNLGRATTAYRYDFYDITPAGRQALEAQDGGGPAAIPNRPADAALRALSRTDYDDLGRPYRSSVFDVDPTKPITDAAVSALPALQSYAWYSPVGVIPTRRQSRRASARTFKGRVGTVNLHLRRARPTGHVRLD